MASESAFEDLKRRVEAIEAREQRADARAAEYLASMERWNAVWATPIHSAGTLKVTPLSDAPAAAEDFFDPPLTDRQVLTALFQVMMELGERVTGERFQFSIYNDSGNALNLTSTGAFAAGRARPREQPPTPP